MNTIVVALHVYQSKQEVEAALVDLLQTYVLCEQALAMVIGTVRAEIEALLPQRHDDIEAALQRSPKPLLSDDVP